MPTQWYKFEVLKEVLNSMIDIQKWLLNYSYRDFEQNGSNFCYHRADLNYLIKTSFDI
jgi:hypothetical protein